MVFAIARIPSHAAAAASQFCEALQGLDFLSGLELTAFGDDNIWDYSILDDALLFNGLRDNNADGFVDLTDLDEIALITELVYAEFSNTRIVFAGTGSSLEIWEAGPGAPVGTFADLVANGWDIRFTAIPVPEPTSLPLLLIGAAALGRLRARAR